MGDVTTELMISLDVVTTTIVYSALLELASDDVFPVDGDSGDGIVDDRSISVEEVSDAALDAASFAIEVIDVLVARSIAKDVTGLLLDKSSKD